MSWAYLVAGRQRGRGMVLLAGPGPALRLPAVVLQQLSVRPSVWAQPEFRLAGVRPRAGCQQLSRWPWAGCWAVWRPGSRGRGCVRSSGHALRGRCGFSGCGPGRCIYTLEVMPAGARPGPRGLASLRLSHRGRGVRGKRLEPGRGWGQCRPLQPRQVWGRWVPGSSPHRPQGTEAAAALDNELAAPVQKRSLGLLSSWVVPDLSPARQARAHCRRAATTTTLAPAAHRLKCTACSRACVHTWVTQRSHAQPPKPVILLPLPPHPRSSGSREQGEVRAGSTPK